MLAKSKLVTLFSILAFEFATQLSAIEVTEPAFAGFGLAIALSDLRKRLLNGEQVQLKAVGFSPFPTLRPQVVTVTISYGGIDRMRMSGRLLRGDRFIISSRNFFPREIVC